MYCSNIFGTYHFGSPPASPTSSKSLVWATSWTKTNGTPWARMYLSRYIACRLYLYAHKCTRGKPRAWFHFPRKGVDGFDIKRIYFENGSKIEKIPLALQWEGIFTQHNLSFISDAMTILCSEMVLFLPKGVNFSPNETFYPGKILHQVRWGEFGLHFQKK